MPCDINLITGSNYRRHCAVSHGFIVDVTYFPSLKLQPQPGSCQPFQWQSHLSRCTTSQSDHLCFSIIRLIIQVSVRSHKSSVPSALQSSYLYTFPAQSSRFEFMDALLVDHISPSLAGVSTIGHEPLRLGRSPLLILSERICLTSYATPAQDEVAPVLRDQTTSKSF